MHAQASQTDHASLPANDLCALLDSLGSVILVAGDDGTILYRNAEARRMLPHGNDLLTVLGDIRVLGEFCGWDGLAKTVGESNATHRWLGVRTTEPSTTDASLIIRGRRIAGGDSFHGVVIQIDERPTWMPSDTNEMSRRLTALGKLTAQVAHELNNPLDGILRYLNLAARLASEMPTSKLQSYLSESRTGVVRMVQVVAELLEFSRATDGEFDEVDINTIVEQAIQDTMSEQKTGGIVLTVDYQSQTMPSMRGNQLYQVCRNLIKNAIDAMPHGGRLSVTTGLTDDHVVIRVADTGVGLPEDPATAFEAFFTTKPAGQGTGLGLAICKDYIENMGGTLSAAAGAQGGAVFTAAIPIGACADRQRRQRSPQNDAQ